MALRPSRLPDVGASGLGVMERVPRQGAIYRAPALAPQVVNVDGAACEEAAH